MKCDQTSKLIETYHVPYFTFFVSCNTTAVFVGFLWYNLLEKKQVYMFFVNSLYIKVLNEASCNICRNLQTYTMYAHKGFVYLQWGRIQLVQIMRHFDRIEKSFFKQAKLYIYILASTIMIFKYLYISRSNSWRVLMYHQF